VLAFLALACAVEVKVTINLGGGAPDPQWTLAGAEAQALIDQLPAVPAVNVARPIPWYRMGYRGFEVQILNGAADDVAAAATVVHEIYNMPFLELQLLISGYSHVSHEVVEHVQGEVKRVQLSMAKGDHQQQLQVPSPLVCKPPVRGSDNNTVYGPATDCDGCFVSNVGDNNCYNYGNDVATNTFAQPGRGTGQKWRVNTCDEMRASAIRDGLEWTGTTLPTANPKSGHFLALLIWPNTNFHWIRFDSVPAGKWSHKAGGTPVKNVDNRGLPITDPSKSDFAPWTQFCGYMTSIPSNVTIN